MNTEQRSRFHALGREHPTVSAATRLAWAMTPEPLHFDWGDSGDRATVELAGFTITLRVAPEEVTPMGVDFTDEDPSEELGGQERIYRNPRAWDEKGARIRQGEYAYGVPMTAYTEHRESLRKLGVSKHSAHTLARGHVLADVARFCDPDYSEYVVTVTASRDGIELASDALGGIGLGEGSPDVIRERLDRVIQDHAMLTNVIEDAQAKVYTLRVSSAVEKLRSVPERFDRIAAELAELRVALHNSDEGRRLDDALDIFDEVHAQVRERRVGAS